MSGVKQETDLERVWNNYTELWKLETEVEKRELLSRCLAVDCHYSDPHVSAHGYDELITYMLDFHQQVPGGHFEIVSFSTHHQQCMVKWLMKNGDLQTLGEGISFGRYNEQGQLMSMTGFF